MSNYFQVPQRIEVKGACERRCFSCTFCPSPHTRSLESVLQAVGENRGVLQLGGGDVTRWSPLAQFLEENQASSAPRQIWIEAPAASLSMPMLASLAKRGLTGVVVHIEAAGERQIKALRVGNGERVIESAEALGLKTSARLAARPETFKALIELAIRLSPRRCTIELLGESLDGKPIQLWAASIEAALMQVSTLNFSTQRAQDRGYLPPCVLPKLWRSRPEMFRSVLGHELPPNDTLSECAQCTLATRCGWRDRQTLAPEQPIEPITTTVIPWERPTSTQNPVPEIIVKKRSATSVICISPWTTMEVVDPDGLVRQCCSTWTAGSRGNVLGTTLLDIWNGPGYQQARRVMSGTELSSLCLPICSRLHDHKFSEREMKIQSGSERFMANQLLLAEEIAERREVLTSKPLRLSLCPSTYCNYNCIMCDHGRSPRRELPVAIWDELPELLPTLQSLTLLGGEPLANPYAMHFLREFDVTKYPDASIDLVTNGSLLTERTLRHLTRCTLGDVTISVNAGTSEIYEQVQRGVAFEQLLTNIDTLIRFRDQHHRWFGITLSFVVQPLAAPTLIEFGEIARARGLRIRLMALNPEQHEGLDFYPDDDKVAKIIAELDKFLAYARRMQPNWTREIQATRSAVLAEAAARRVVPAPAPNVRRLQVLS